MCEETTLAIDACEWDQGSYNFVLQFRATVLKEPTVGIIQRVCRTMATPGDESVKKKQSETEKAGQSGRPGNSGMIRVE